MARKVSLAAIRACALLLVLLGAACAGSSGHVDGPAVAIDAGRAPPAPKPPERPFARTASEAQNIIEQQIRLRTKTLWDCVEDYRARKRDRHRAVTVDIGIDQEGGLLGVITADPSAGDLEPALKACMMRALRGAAFPRSHAGVITVRQSFRDAGS